MRLCRLILAIALGTLSFTLFSGVAKSQEQDVFGRRVVDSLFNSGGFSFYFDQDIATIADAYVSKTKFAGKVRVNQPLLAGYLNIYVFKRGKGFGYDRFLRNTCRAFSDVDAIICDHNFLDSMPSSMLLVFEGGPDRIPPPSLMFWVIGHEIGHLILRHTASSFAGADVALALDSVARDQPATVSGRTPAQQELDADLFAASGLPITGHMDWIYFGNPIVDAFWGRLADYKEKSSDLTTAEGPERVLVNYDSTGHPALVERLYRLLRAVERIFTSASSITGLVEKVEFVVDGSVGREYADTFYGQIYLGSADEAEVHARRLADLAAQIVSTGSQPSKKMRDAICIDKSGDVNDLDWIEQAIICAYDAPVGTVLRDCANRDKEDVLRCISLIPLLDEACARDNSRSQKLCGGVEGMSDAVKSAIASGLVLPSDTYFLSKWAFPGIYRYMQRKGLLDKEQLFQMAIALSRIDSVPASASIKTEMVLLHASGIENDPSADWAEVANLSMAVADHGQSVGDDLLAVKYQTKVVELIEREMAADSLELAFHKLKLANIMRTAGIHVMGSNDGLVSSMTDDQFTAVLVEQSNAMRSKSASLAEAAAEIYLQSAVKLEAEPQYQDVLDVRRISYINALGGAVFSYNLALLPDEALRVSDRLMKEIEAHPELHRVDTFDRRSLAPALENIATAHVQSAGGNVQLAITVIQRALAINEAANGSSIHARRIAAYAYYRNREWLAAATMTKRFVNDFEQSSLRVYNLESGMLAAGKIVGADDILSTVAHR